jgi:hypothetical protein
VLWLMASLAMVAAAGAEEKTNPEILRTRERIAMLDLRTVMMAGKEYAALNGGYFGPPECLTAPAKCRPDLPKDQAPILDPSHDWMATRIGYDRKFHPGPPLAEDVRARARAAVGSLKAYAFTVSPTKPGETGIRSFCGDSTGRVCAMANGVEPPVRDGRCLPACKDLQ